MPTEHPDPDAYNCSHSIRALLYIEDIVRMRPTAPLTRFRSCFEMLVEHSEFVGCLDCHRLLAYFDKLLEGIRECRFAKELQISLKYLLTGSMIKAPMTLQNIFQNSSRCAVHNACEDCIELVLPIRELVIKPNMRFDTLELRALSGIEPSYRRIITITPKKGLF